MEAAAIVQEAQLAERAASEAAQNDAGSAADKEDPAPVCDAGSAAGKGAPAAEIAHDLEGWDAGSHVVVRDLVSRQELNGRVGIIVGSDVHAGRLMVRLHGTGAGEGIKLKPENVSQIELREGVTASAVQAAHVEQ
jgi:hypothetical protein